jgi:Holliday junction resolvasome RuvABC endonuclease subunit
MIVLILDPGSSTGYCIVNIDIEKSIAVINEYGFIKVDLSSEYQGDHCINLMERIQEIIDEKNINHIGIEDYFFSNRYLTGCNVNGAFRTAIHILARQNNLKYNILNISAWKNFVAGKSTPTKEQKKKWGPGPAKKLYIQQALYEKFGFRFPNHSISEKTKKPILFCYDIVDSVGLAVYFCCIIQQIPKKNIALTVEVPKDYIFKRKTKKQFNYSDYTINSKIN